MRRINRRFIGYCLIITAGFAGGIFLPEMIHMNSGTYAGMFSVYSFQKFLQQEIQMRDVFLYIFSKRMELLLFLWLSSFTGAGIWIHALAGGWISCSAGMLLRLFCMKKGIQGILLFLCCLMPQWLLYGIMWKREVTICFGKKEHLWFTFINLLMLCVGGCVCETWIGIQFQKKILKIFL